MGRQRLTLLMLLGKKIKKKYGGGGTIVVNKRRIVHPFKLVIPKRGEMLLSTDTESVTRLGYSAIQRVAFLRHLPF